MEAPHTTVQKPASTQDAVLGLAPSTRSAGDAEQFDKIFEDASQKMKTEEIGRHTSELQSHSDLVCRLLLEKKKKNQNTKKKKNKKNTKNKNEMQRLSSNAINT